MFNSICKASDRGCLDSFPLGANRDDAIFGRNLMHEFGIYFKEQFFRVLITELKRINEKALGADCQIYFQRVVTS